KHWGHHMHAKRTLTALVATVIAGASLPAAAQTIYPLTRAEILAGAKFDFKVEFPGPAPAPDLKVTVNGRDAAEVFGKAAGVEANEEGQGHTAYWIRGASLAKPGSYEVTASAGGKSDRQVGRVRHASPARAQRHPVHRRRPVDGAPGGGAGAGEGLGRRALRRRA